jgi:predicted metal-dependent hydrolase
MPYTNDMKPSEHLGSNYNVMHELCHFHHLNHTEAFWNEVDKVMPNFRERREWLKRNGAAMDI